MFASPYHTHPTYPTSLAIVHLKRVQIACGGLLAKNGALLTLNFFIFFIFYDWSLDLTQSAIDELKAIDGVWVKFDFEE